MSTETIITHEGKDTYSYPSPERKGYAEVEPVKVDLRERSYGEVCEGLTRIAEAGNYVMHGSSLARGELDELDPTISTIGGKKPSIYASDDPRAAIFNAVYNKHGEWAKQLRSVDYGHGASSTMHMKRGRGYPSFVIPEAQAEALREAIKEGASSELYQGLLGDGVVYMAPKSYFSQESPKIESDSSSGLETTDHEWNTQVAVRPEVMCYVSPEIIVELLKFDGPDQNVEIMSSDSMRAENIKQISQQFEAVLPEGVTLDASALDSIVKGGGEKVDEKAKFIEFAKDKVGEMPRDEFAHRLAELYDDYKKAIKSE
jgi:hypothetical protein